MKSDEPNWSEFQSIDHINASMALNELTSELEERNRIGLPWIACAEARGYMEQEQADLLKQARKFSDEWEKSREECGRAPTYPGAIMTRQAPNFDHFTAQAVMLAKALENYQLGEMLATCDLISDALEKERKTVKTLSRQIKKLDTKAGESNALRGQIEAMETTIQILQDSQTNTQTIFKAANDIKAQLNRIEKKTDGIPALVQDATTEEGKAALRMDGIFKAINGTTEEREVFKAWFNSGGKKLSQSEVSRKTKLSISTVRRRANSFNQKAKGKGILIEWQATPMRDTSPAVRDKVK